MGQKLLALYGNKVKNTWKIAFFSAFFLGLLVHMYQFTNYSPNHDGLYNFYGSQNMIGSGRWFLAAACSLSTFFDLPWVIGVVSVTFMALTAAVITEVFGMENPCLIVVCSGLLVSFPAVAETMFFAFTADGYMAAMFLGALAVAVSKIPHCGSRKRFLLSAACICLVCAIYQAYVSFAFVLAVCYFLYELLENRYAVKAYGEWIAYQAGIYLVGLLSYYAVWQILLKASGTAASSYEGISAIGVVNAGTILTAIKNSLVSFVWFFLERNPLKYGLSVYSVLGCLFGIAFVAVCAAAFFKSGIFRRKLEAVLFLLCLIVLPFGCYLCYFVSPGTQYYTRMLQSIVVLYLFLGVLCERWIGAKYKDLILVLLIAVTVNHSLTANVAYAYLNRCHEQSLAAAVELSTRIHLEDDGTARYIAFLGGQGGPASISEEDYMDSAKLGTLGPVKSVNYSLLSGHDLIILFLSQYTDFTLEYYQANDLEFPVYHPDPNAPVAGDFEFRFPIAEEARRMELKDSEETAQMGIWPAKDSVKLIGDTIVVKLSEE